MKLGERFEEFRAAQQRCPSGFAGWFFGEQMAHQHIEETNWSIEQLRLQPTDDVLEIGFGAGKAIKRMATLVSSGTVSGIDLSYAMLETASRRNAQAMKDGRVILRHGNITALPFADQQFDKVLSIHTFYFWPDVLRGTAEIFRVLRPNGRSVVTLSTGKVGTDKQTGLEHYQTVLEQQILPYMQQLGFASASIEQGPVSRQYNSVAVIGMK